MSPFASVSNVSTLLSLWDLLWLVKGQFLTIFLDRCHCHCRFEVHCNGNSVYILLFWELRGLSPNFHIHVSVSDFCITRISPHISSSRKGRPIVGIYNSLTDTWMWKLGLRPRYSFSGNICFHFSAFCLCSAWQTAYEFTEQKIIDEIFQTIDSSVLDLNNYFYFSCTATDPSMFVFFPLFPLV